MSSEDREISATQRWGIGIIITIFIASVSVFMRLGNLEQQINQNASDIGKNEDRITSVAKDLRDILVGIEQVKARLGIVETK